MKKPGHILLFFLFLTCQLFAGNDLLLRQRININREWKFKLGDYLEASEIEYDDKDWSDINIPHNFSIPYFQSPHWYTGFGWYRKYFDVPEDWSDKRVFVEFEGAFREADIFINGVKVGIHKGGYTGFSIDITNNIKAGRNLMSVRLNNNWSPQLAPRNGDHNFTGGIYRDVYLLVTNKVYVTWFGSFITTSDLSAKSGIVNVRTEVRNKSSQSKRFSLKTLVLDQRDKIVSSVVSENIITSDSLFEFVQKAPKIKNPKLWHPEHPYLYKVVSYVMDGKKCLDRYESTFGFRWVEWTADKGFFINGEQYYFRGANVHQDHAGWASAVTNAAITRDVRMVKDCGMDFIRGSHYPHDPSFSDACDSLGILLWEENDFWGSGGSQRESDNWYEGSGAYPPNVADQIPFEESVKTNLREMIRIHRNHPSIIIWSMCNEPFFTDWRTTEKVRKFLKVLVDLTHELDPSRKVGIGGCQRGEMDKIGDVAGYNGDGARLFMDPGIANVVTEYGSTIARRPGKYIPGWGDLQKEKYAWRSGEALWCAFDYGTRAGDFGLMGMVDYFRLPKDMWYWYRNEYRKIKRPEPAIEGVAYRLKLTSDKNIICNTDGTDDIFLTVSVLNKEGVQLSNSPDVTLQIVSGPGEFPTGRKIVFGNKSDIYIRDGKAAIEFRSYFGGKTCIVASSDGLINDTIHVETKGLPIYIEGVSCNIGDRPYERYVWKKPVKESISTNNIAFQKPTRASSEMPGKTANFANDNDSITLWQPKAGTGQSWWQVDLENLYIISEIRVLFSDAEAGFSVIESSTDNLNWEKVPVTINKSAYNTITCKTDNKKRIRFIRISFNENNKPVSLKEVKVLGSADQ